MDGTCSTHGRDAKCIQILVGKIEGNRTLGNLGLYGNVILKYE